MSSRAEGGPECRPEWTRSSDIFVGNRGEALLGPRDIQVWSLEIQRRRLSRARIFLTGREHSTILDVP